MKTPSIPLIISHPGVGKSEIQVQVCDEFGVHYIVDYPSLREPTDYVGLLFANATKTYCDALPMGILKAVFEATEPTLLHFDEIGQGSESTQKALMSFIQTRTVNGRKIPDCVRFSGSTNYRTDIAGVTGMLEPLKNRFYPILEVKPKIDHWVRDYALPQGLPVDIIAHERFAPEFIEMSNWKASRDLIPSATPRSITNLARLYATDPPEHLRYAMFSGTAGEAYTAHLQGFLKVLKKLPSIDYIMMEPEKAELVPDPGVMFAVCTALAHKASQQNLGQIIKYANRFKKIDRADFSIMLVKDIIAKDRSLTNTKAFISWSVEHSDILI